MGDIGIIQVETNVKVTYTTTIHLPDISQSITFHLVQNDLQELQELEFNLNDVLAESEDTIKHFYIPVGKNVLIHISLGESLLINENGELYFCRKNTETNGPKHKRFLNSLYVEKLKRDNEVCEKHILERTVNEKGEVEFVKKNENNKYISCIKPSSTFSNSDCEKETILFENVESTYTSLENSTGNNEPAQEICENIMVKNEQSQETTLDQLGSDHSDSETVRKKENGQKKTKKKKRIRAKENIKCFLCNTFECKTEKELAVHRSTDHASEKPSSRYKCFTCGKSSSNKELYRSHLRTHLSKKTFQCTQCDKSFALHKQLDKHSLLHTDKRPFLCYVCGKSFTRLNVLNKHTLIHNGEKPHKCEECDSRFMFRYQLENHLLVHSDKPRPFLCDTCGRDFNLKPELTQHIKKRHGPNADAQKKKCRKCEIEQIECSHRWTLPFRRKSLKKP